MDSCFIKPTLSPMNLVCTINQMSLVERGKISGECEFKLLLTMTEINIL